MIAMAPKKPVMTDEALYHVSVLAASVGANNSNTNMRNRTVALVEIIEIADFEATLEFVDADGMQAAIDATGHIALYGIQFDHDKATLRPESLASIAEITKYLESDSRLYLYVVGHTDDVGALDYNRDLSLRRAETVVTALREAGIDGQRLTALGVGPATPVGNNETDKGRASNRRVELVKRKGP